MKLRVIIIATFLVFAAFIGAKNIHALTLQQVCEMSCGGSPSTCPSFCEDGTYDPDNPVPDKAACDKICVWNNPNAFCPDDCQKFKPNSNSTFSSPRTAAAPTTANCLRMELTIQATNWPGGIITASCPGDSGPNCPGESQSITPNGIINLTKCSCPPFASGCLEVPLNQFPAGCVPLRIGPNCGVNGRTLTQTLQVLCGGGPSCVPGFTNWTDTMCGVQGFSAAAKCSPSERYQVRSCTTSCCNVSDLERCVADPTCPTNGPGCFADCTSDPTICSTNNASNGGCTECRPNPSGGGNSCQTPTTPPACQGNCTVSDANACGGSSRPAGCNCIADPNSPTGGTCSTQPPACSGNCTVSDANACGGSSRPAGCNCVADPSSPTGGTCSNQPPPTKVCNGPCDPAAAGACDGTSSIGCKCIPNPTGGGGTCQVPPITNATCKCDGLTYTTITAGGNVKVTAFGKVEDINTTFAKISSFNFQLLSSAKGSTNANKVTSQIVTATQIINTPTLARYQAVWDVTIPKDTTKEYRIHAEPKCDRKLTQAGNDPNELVLVKKVNSDQSLLGKVMGFVDKVLGTSSYISGTAYAQKQNIQLETFIPATTITSDNCSFIKFAF